MPNVHTHHIVHLKNGRNYKFVIADIFPLFAEGLVSLLKARESTVVTAGILNTRILIETLETVCPDAIFIAFEKEYDAHLINYLQHRYWKTPIFAMTKGSEQNLDTLCLNTQVKIITRGSSPELIRSNIYKILSSTNKNTVCTQKSINQKSPLTHREKLVLREFLTGQSMTQIASRLNRSIKTISSQKMSARERLNTHSDAELNRLLRGPAGIFLLQK